MDSTAHRSAAASGAGRRTNAMLKRAKARKVLVFSQRRRLVRRTCRQISATACLASHRRFEMHKRINLASLGCRHRYEMTFSLDNSTKMGARQVAEGQGRFVGRPYDNRDLEKACTTLAQAAPTDPLREGQADRLNRFIARGEKLLDKKMAQPGFVFPSLKMSQGAFNLQEIKEQIGEEWDAVVHRLRPFINQDLYGENIINIVTSAWRQHPEFDPIKKTIRRYYLLEGAARYRDLYVYRRGDVVMVASVFKDGVFEASGDRGSFLHINCFSKEADQDTQEDRQRLQNFIDDPNAEAFRGGVPYAYCRTGQNASAGPFPKPLVLKGF
jgi:hypothetical protein